MDTRGTFAPESASEASERFEQIGSTAQVLVRELARAMDFDAGEYEERVTPDVVATAREVLFAEQLRVSVGSYEEFEAFRAATDAEVEVIGTENVENVAWHAPPFSEVAVAATFQDEADAAVGTLRRQAFGRIYESVV
jgi:hypothetical protein